MCAGPEQKIGIGTYKLPKVAIFYVFFKFDKFKIFLIMIQQFLRK